MSDAEEVRAAWDALDEKTKETLRAFGIRPSCDADELDAALAAWRGLSGEERAQAMRLVYNMPDPAGEIVERLLKAAGR
jgi:hypothetical protein